MVSARAVFPGLGARLFTITGPVFVYGTVASVLYGVVYWVLTIMQITRNQLFPPVI